MYHIKLAVLL